MYTCLPYKCTYFPIHMSTIEVDISEFDKVVIKALMGKGIHVKQ